MAISYNSGLIRAIRGLLDKEQAAMASLCKVSRRTYIEAERGRSCSAATWREIAAAGERNGITMHKLPGGTLLHISDALRDKIEERDRVASMNAHGKMRVLPRELENT